MGLHRDTVFIEAMSMCNNSAFGGGECVSLYKNKWGEWVTKDSRDKKWRMLSGHIRNKNILQINKQYTVSDIVYKLFDISDNYQTVCWESLEDAIEEALENLEYGWNVNDVTKYITTYLL